MFIDEESKQTGKLEEGWDFLLPEEIKDPKESKVHASRTHTNIRKYINICEHMRYTVHELAL